MRFVGGNAIAAYEAVFPEIAADDPFSDQGAPVEEFGPGAALSHCDEETFGDDEIMTGFLGAGSNALTDLTIASVEDLGYATTFEDTPLA